MKRKDLTDPNGTIAQFGRDLNAAHQQGLVCPMCYERMDVCTCPRCKHCGVLKGECTPNCPSYTK